MKSDYFSFTEQSIETESARVCNTFFKYIGIYRICVL